MREQWQDRVVDEKAELSLKLRALEAFINSEAFEVLGEAEKARLRSQRYFMHGYAETLNERISAFYEADA